MAFSSTLIRYLKKIFEPKKKNSVSLFDDSYISGDLKPVKVGEKNSIVELSESELKVRGTIDADAITVNGASVSTEPDDDTIVITALNNATENELVTVGATTTELDAENTLTYTANNLVFKAGDSRIGVYEKEDDDGYDLDVHGGNAEGFNNAGGDLYLNAGRGTGDGLGGDIFFTSSNHGSSSSTLRGEVQIGKLGANGDFRLSDADGTEGRFISYNLGTTTDGAELNSTGVRLPTGTLTLDGDGGTIALDDGGLTYATFTQSDSSFKLHEAGQDAGVDYFKIACGANGASTISTNEQATGTVGHLTLAPEGQLILKSGADLYEGIKCDASLKIAEQADAAGDTAGYGQIWVDNLAPNVLMFTDDIGTDYQIGPSPGTILGYTRLQGDLTSQSIFEIEDAITVEDDTHKVTFKTPPSEYVEIEASFCVNNLSTSIVLTAGLSDADASTGYNSIGVQYEYDYLGVNFSDGEADDSIHTVSWILPAAELAAIGSSNTFWIGFGTAGATKTAYLTYGVRASHGICTPPFIIKATALPATIYEG